MSISSSNKSGHSQSGDADPIAPDEQFISKTVLKREAEALQKLGRRIAELTEEQRLDLQLPEKLLHAILEYNRFPSREAKRRQLQYVGKLMRVADVEHIQTRLDDLDGQSAAAKSAFHQSELWRERLIAEPSALSAYIDEHPHVERQALRHAVKKARSAKNPDQAKIAARELFRFLRNAEDTQA